MSYMHLIAAPSGARVHNLTLEEPPAALAEPGDSDTEQLTSLMAEIARQLQADDVLVAWHDGGEPPAILFADGGVRARSAAEHAMILTAEEAARGCRVARSDWRELENGAAGGLLTASMPAHGGVVTMTARFARLGDTTHAHARDGNHRLMPLIQPFFWMWGLRRRLLKRLRGLTAAVNNSDLGIVLVDRHARVLFTNASADALIAQDDGLRLSGGALGGAKLADTMRLRAAIEHVCDDHGAVHGPAPVVALFRRDRRPLLISVTCADAGAADGDEDMAVLHLFDPEQNLAQLIEPACKLYGLSPVETRLTSLLADGMSLTDAATKMRVREQTARSYLKQIFGKTQTNRQAELVWLMLKSSVRTAPGCRASFV